MDNYKSLKISIEKVMRNPEMLKFVRDTKKICKHVHKKVTFSNKICS